MKSRSLLSRVCLLATAMLVMIGSVAYADGPAEPTLASAATRTMTVTEWAALMPAGTLVQVPENPGATVPEAELKNQTPPDYSPPVTAPATVKSESKTTSQATVSVAPSGFYASSSYVTSGGYVTNSRMSNRTYTKTYVTKQPRQRRRTKVTMVAPVTSMTAVAPVTSFVSSYQMQAICPGCGRPLDD